MVDLSFCINRGLGIVWRDVKIYVARKALKLAQVVEAALRKYLQESEKEG